MYIYIYSAVPVEGARLLTPPQPVTFTPLLSRNAEFDVRKFLLKIFKHSNTVLLFFSILLLRILMVTLPPAAR